MNPIAEKPNPALAAADRSSQYFDHAPLPMAMVEESGHIVRYVNPAFCRLLGKPKGKLVGKPFGEMLPEKEVCLALFDRVFRTGKPESHMEKEASPAKSPPTFWSYTAWPVRAEGHMMGIMIQVTETARFHAMSLAMTEALMVGAVRQHELIAAADSSNALLKEEIGERKLSEAALHKAQAQLSDRAGQLEGLVAKRTTELSVTNQHLEAFVYSIAHDLRAPLRTMQGFSSLLVEDAGAILTEEGRGYAERINKSALFMDALLCDLLAFSRISQQHVELATVNLEAVVGTVVSRLQNEIKEQDARVEGAGPWPGVLAHESTLIQVVFNLVSNALKFARPGVPALVRVRTEEAKAFVRVWVEDNGIGIPADHQEQIFALFTRLHGGNYEGTGIGLAIVQKGVERMGGKVGVESMAGEGSRFWFELRKA